jgi:hypothetical protein|uniref:Uncharacterized protein n=1 Tax=Siphoviridae sp. ctHip2 TaxID=2827830 RepID=A0A8S5RWV4_9CAUD|nr:MAG TPA: hypothetical protein [Siphoviridae sp. ctHip2]
MSNNLIELKYDRVKGFFDEMIAKYEVEYQNNKTTTEKIYVSNVRRVLESILIIFIMIAFCGGLIWFIKSGSNYTKTEFTDKFIKVIDEDVIPLLAPFVGIIFVGLINIKLMKVILGIRPNNETRTITKTLSKKKYFTKIKADMLYYVRYNLSYSITENMLIFDKYGMIIGPDLSTNENKKIFGEVEHKLEQKNE